MPSTPYMKLYIGDYLGDTQHLTCLEHGAYILLIMAYWQNGGPLKNDPKLLRRLTKTSPKEFRKCSENVLKMFQTTGSILVHKRIEKELTERSQVSISARDAANARWCGRNANASKKTCERNATPIVHRSIDPEEESLGRERGLTKTPAAVDSKPPVFFGQAGTSRFEKAKEPWTSRGLPSSTRKNLFEIRDEDRRDILATFSHYSDAEIEAAIKNYADIIGDERYEITGKYGSLTGFLRSGVEKFVDDAKPRDAYLKIDPEEAAREAQFERIRRKANATD